MESNGISSRKTVFRPPIPKMSRRCTPDPLLFGSYGLFMIQVFRRYFSCLACRALTRLGYGPTNGDPILDFPITAPTELVDAVRAVEPGEMYDVVEA